MLFVLLMLDIIVMYIWYLTVRYDLGILGIYLLVDKFVDCFFLDLTLVCVTSLPI